MTGNFLTLRPKELADEMARRATPATYPTPARLRAAAKDLLRGLAADLAEAHAGSSVHGARRRIKTLRSLIRLLRPVVGDESYAAANDAARRAADALAGQRRAEALVVAAGKTAGRRKVRDQIIQLAEAHRAAHHADPDAPDRIEEARAAIAEAQAIVTAWTLPRGEAKAIGGAFLDHYRKAKKRLKSAFASGEAEALHEARKQVIHHLHHLQLLQPWLDQPMKKRLDDLEHLREILGDLNDLDELEQLARAEGDTPPEAVKALDRRRAKLIGKARKAAKPLFKDPVEAFAKRIGAMWAARG